MSRLLIVAGMVAVALVVAPSCGGGGGGRDTSLDVTFDAPPLAAWDGLTSTRPTNPVPWVDNNYATGISCGDWDWGIAPPDQEVRGFFTFDINLLPAPPAVVRAAMLTIRVWGTTGVPLPAGIQCNLERVNLGASFDGADHSASGALVQTVTTNPAVATYVIDVRSEIGADQIAGFLRSSFRVRLTGWSNLNDGNDTTLNFNDAEDREGSGIIPKLTITYTP
jgi:hypothetical protein